MTRWVRWTATVPLALGLAVLMGATQALADGDCHPFGNTARVHGHEKGGILLTSDTSQKVAFGGVDVSVPAGLTFAGLHQLSTDYEMTEGTCIGGSPRFQVNVLKPGDSNPNDVKNIFVYFGSAPENSAATCPEAIRSEVNTGNFAAPGLPGDTPGRYDTSQLLPGTQISTYSATLLLFGSWQVTGIQVVVDGGFAAGPQTALIDGLQVNGETCLVDRERDAP